MSDDNETKIAARKAKFLKEMSLKERDVLKHVYGGANLNCNPPEEPEEPDC